MGDAETMNRRFWCLVIVLVAMLGACATPEKKSAATPQGDIQLVWPAPPDPPRYKYEAILRSQADIHLQNSEERMRSLMTGQTVSDDPILAKPAGIAARKGRIYVADAQASGITVFDVPRRKVFRFGWREPNRLVKPVSVAVDDAGNVYVLDAKLKRVMVFDPLGLFLFSLGEKAGLVHPTGVAVSADGQAIYVVDRGTVEDENHRVISFAPNDTERFRLGPRGNEPGRFNVPLEAAVDARGDLYVLDSGNFRVQVFDPTGKYLREWGGPGAEFGRFARARGIAVGPDNNVYVSDASFGNVQIFEPSGQLLMALGERSLENKPGNFGLVGGVAVDETNRLYVVDQYFSKVEVFRRLPDSVR